MRIIVRSLICLTLSLGVCTMGAVAQTDHNRYKWRDGQGNLHFDDALPIEALKYGYDIIGPTGLVIRHVARERTPEELKADEAAEAKRAAAQKVAAEQAKADQQLLAAYPNEKDLLNAQKAQIDMLDQNIHATQISLESQEKSLTDMLAHAADLERSGKPVSAALRSQIESLRHNVEDEKAYITRKQREKVDRKAQFVGDMAHYRELQAAQNKRTNP